MHTNFTLSFCPYEQYKNSHCISTNTQKIFPKNSLLHKNTHATKIIQTTAENQLDFQWDSPYRSIQLLMIYKAGTKKKKKQEKTEIHALSKNMSLLQ